MGIDIDWGNTGFLRLYAIVFGLSTVLTMIMWLISVVKRVIRGVPFGQAIMENVGYLLTSVTVASLAPAAVAYTVDFVDSAAEAILGDYLASLAVGGGAIFTVLGIISMSGAGAVIAIPISSGILLSLFGLWVMLVVRDAMILLGLIFGPLVFSGLVDKDLWGHTRKWAGVMGGLIVSKLGIFLALALAGALLDGIMRGKPSVTGAIGASITFLALLFLALVMPFQVAKWLPVVGDEIQSMHQAKGEAVQRAQSAAARLKQGQQSDMKNQADNKPSSSGPTGGTGTGGGTATSAAAGPAAAAVEAKKAIDGAREQVEQAVTDGANNASGTGGQQAGHTTGSSSGTGKGRGSERVPRGGGGSEGARRPAPPPPRRQGSGSGAAPSPPPPPPPRPGGQAPPPPTPPPPPGR
ncbi:hypothetical protein [Streptomyces sp. NPDC056304]|uniref:hypothetical protein n=1 Tax=Streptomyces sp. NPDC056304 TaxID=3345778 RepID=UPI0035DAD358